jgi:AcrR family transcriptional regulator
LLDAALEVFVERGFAAARTDDVAQRAGVSKGTLYLYYPSKDELLKAVISHSVSAQIAEGARLAEAHTGSTIDLMRTLVVPWWQRLAGSPASGVFKLMVTEARNFPEVADFYAREVLQPGEALLTRVIRRGIDSGEFRDVDVRHTVYSLLFPMVMVCVHKHSLGACAIEPALDPDCFIAEHVELLIAALRGPPAPAAPPGDS